jgi:hypothetical protein
LSDGSSTHPETGPPLLLLVAPLLPAPLLEAVPLLLVVPLLEPVGPTPVTFPPHPWLMAMPNQSATGATTCINESFMTPPKMKEAPAAGRGGEYGAPPRHAP